MKILVRKIILIIVLSVGIICGLCFLSGKESFTSLIDMMTNSVTYQGVGKIETMELLDRVKASKGADKLILGDSVANQIYEYRDNEEYEIKCGNMAMTLVWQYIFVEQYLKQNPDTKEIILCIVPETLVSNFEVERTYSYVLIPMLEAEKEEAIEKEDWENLSKMYGSVFVEPSIIRFVGASGLNTKLYLNGIKKFYSFFPARQKEVEKKGDIDLSFSERYLLKIKNLCDKKGVKFTLLPNPVKNTSENQKKLEAMEEAYQNSDLYSINPEFFEQILFFEPEHFKDELHFKDEFLENGGKNTMIEQIQIATGTLEGLLE